VILGFAQALAELEDEGGIEKRSQRYQENHQVLIQGMESLGFKPYLKHSELGYIITSFHYLEHSGFSYQTFYERLQKRGYVIYSGKVSNAQCFRVGNIGRIFRSDILNLISAMRDVLNEMGIK
jgi:2-aminoethylphosphonate-pyruvate transaminase